MTEHLNTQMAVDKYTITNDWWWSVQAKPAKLIQLVDRTAVAAAAGGDVI
jgi:hypothetical protein